MRFLYIVVILVSSTFSYGFQNYCPILSGYYLPKDGQFSYGYISTAIVPAPVFCGANLKFGACFDRINSSEKKDWQLGNPNGSGMCDGTLTIKSESEFEVYWKWWGFNKAVTYIIDPPAVIWKENPVKRTVKVGKMFQLDLRDVANIPSGYKVLLYPVDGFGPTWLKRDYKNMIYGTPELKDIGENHFYLQGTTYGEPDYISPNGRRTQNLTELYITVE